MTSLAEMPTVLLPTLPTRRPSMPAGRLTGSAALPTKTVNLSELLTPTMPIADNDHVPLRWLSLASAALTAFIFGWSYMNVGDYLFSTSVQTFLVLAAGLCLVSAQAGWSWPQGKHVKTFVSRLMFMGGCYVLAFVAGVFALTNMAWNALISLS